MNVFLYRSISNRHELFVFTNNTDLDSFSCRLYAFMNIFVSNSGSSFLLPAFLDLHLTVLLTRFLSSIIIDIKMSILSPVGQIRFLLVYPRFQCFVSQSDPVFYSQAIKVSAKSNITSLQLVHSHQNVEVRLIQPLGQLLHLK